MKSRLLIITLLFLNTLVFAQKQFFKPEKMLETVVYYYPEAWNPDQWDRDLKKIAEMGFEFTHVAEFAWAQIEPTEGVYDFKWLDKVLEIADKYKLKVIMCTPSATPPVWLSRKYPEILLEKPSGETAMHGTREHYSWSSPKYQELTKKVVEAMARHFGNDKRVWGWQIDNEPSHYGTLDYSPSAQASFRVWLKKKYKSIDALNNAWGTAFWSGIYSDFSQIEMPNEGRLISGTASPTSMVDMKRFNADECAAFIGLQCKTLKNFTSKSQFVTTNFMHDHTDVDPWRSKDLDFISYTMYPVAGYSEGVGSQGFRLGDSWRISYSNDFFRSLNGVTGVMELQPGQVNWGKYNPQPYPGAVRSWLWNAFAGGLNFICSYRFRHPLFGGEQFHYGMVGTDGVTELNGGQQYRTFMKEIQDLRKIYTPNAVMPKEYAVRKTALVYNIDNVWETSIQPQTSQWNEKAHITKYYSSLKTLSVPVDIVGEDCNLSAYNVVIAPAYQMMDNTLLSSWQKYVENGGNLVLSCRTGLKDRNGHFMEASWSARITGLIGVKIAMNDMLDSKMKAKISFNGNSFIWNIWADILEPNAGTETWATYSDQFYAGKAAVVHRKLGKGTVTFIGVDSNDANFEKEVLKKVYETAGIGIQELPEGVILNWRDGFFIANNYSSSNVTLEIPANANILVGTKDLTPAGVLVWK